MNILFLLDYYLPNASANGICIDKIVKEYQKNGDNVYLLTFNNCDVREDHGTSNIYYCCKNQQDRVKTNPFVYYLKWFLPLNEPTYKRKAVVLDMEYKAKSIILSNRIDLVVCVHLPVETLIVGRRLKEVFPQIRFVAYMLDSLSGGNLPNYLPKEFCKRKKIKWENRLLSLFDKIVLMQAARNHHQKYSMHESWYKKSIYLDIPAFTPQNINHENENMGVKKIIFTGTLADDVRTPYYFLRVLNELELNIEFIIVGNSKCSNYIKYCNSPYIKICQYGLLSKEKTDSLVSKSDVLISFGNINVNLVPSKIFEYMATGKPIIATYRSKYDSSIEYLKKYPTILLLDENDNDYKAQAKKLQLFLTNNHNLIDIRLLEEEFILNTPRAFINELAMCVGE